MNLRIIGAFISKDLSLFFRNRFFASMTVLGIIVYIAIYFVMPKQVDETLQIGLYTQATLPFFEQVQEEGLTLQAVDSEEALKEGVVEGEYVAGVVLPADILESFMSGQKPRISVYFASDAPPEIKESVESIIRELAFLQAGQVLPIEVTEEILGPDMLGKQIPPRDRMRPLFAVLLLIVETMGLANLLSQEVERGTIRAVLVTPMSVIDLFAAKGAVGVGLAFIQSVLFIAVVGGMNTQPLIILVALLLGAVLVTGIGFLIAALGKDMMSVMAWGIMIFVLLSIPSFGVAFPGTVTDWIKAVPSYYLVDTIHRAANFGSGWGDIWYNLLILLGFDIAFFWIGIIVLRRKFR